MHAQRMFELAHALAVAKSRQDVPAALRLFHPGMVLETPAFGTTARGLPGNERAYLPRCGCSTRTWCCRPRRSVRRPTV